MVGLSARMMCMINYLKLQTMNIFDNNEFLIFFDLKQQVSLWLMHRLKDHGIKVHMRWSMQRPMTLPCRENILKIFHILKTN
jgi:hypothetical protein